MGTPVVMPQLGESVVEGKIGKWLKKVGDEVKLYEPVFEVETDKVTSEVTASGEGTLLKLYFNEGDTAQAGALVAYIGQPGETPPDSGVVDLHNGHTSIETQTTEKQPARKRVSAKLSPVVARIAAEHDVDVSQIEGTGEGGRVTRQDILAYIEARSRVGGQTEESRNSEFGSAAELSPWEYPSSGELFKPSEETSPQPPSAPPSAPGARSQAKQTPQVEARVAPAAPRIARSQASQAAEVVPLNTMRRAIAEHMVRSVQTSPHVTTVWEADCSRLVAHREAHKAAFEHDGARLTFTPYFIMAVVEALKNHPLVNSSWSEDGIVLHRQVNIGVAVSLQGEGLIVPVIKNADSMNLLGLARAVNDLAERARHKQLTPDETQGGTFSLTNHGTLGGLFATPIIHQPQCAILGIGKIEKRPVVITQGGVDALAIKPMAYLSLSFDHRILDGAGADGFMATAKQTLEQWNEH